MVFFFFKILLTVSFYLFLGKFTVNKILKYEVSTIFDYSIIGIITVSTFALIINFFFPLNITTNSILFFFVLGIIFYSKTKIKRRDLYFISIICFITFIIVLYDNEYRPDAGLYHLPYTQILNENNILIGLSNLHNRFGHISIVQYLSASNLNIFTGKTGIIIPTAIIFAIIYLYFLNDLYNFFTKKECLTLGKIFSFFILIYITYKINRYSEFGNDAPAHLIFFYLVSKFLYLKKNSYASLNKIYLFSTYLFLNKVFFIFTFILPIYLIYKKKNFFPNVLKSIPTTILLLWLLKNILISGCAIFPVKITCIENFKWTNIELIKKTGIESEAWAKGWPQNKSSNINIDEFSKNFNWITAWLSLHFKYIIKILLPYIFVVFLFLIYLINIKKNYNQNLIVNEKIFILGLLSIVGSVSFFIKFPIYRYGYSYLILTIFILSSLTFKFLDKNRLLSLGKILFFLSLTIITSKQFLRIYNFYGERNYLPDHIFVKKDIHKNKYKKIKLSNNFNYYYSADECFYGLSPCSNYNYQTNKKLKHQKFFIFNIIYLN